MPRKKLPPCPRCSYVDKVSGNQCRKKAVRGKTRCKSHALGGAPPKHGRYMRALNDPETQQKFVEALEDPDLLSLKSSYAVIDTWKLDDLSKTITGKASDAAWLEAASVLAGLEECIDELLEGHTEGFYQHFDRLKDILTVGVDSANAKERFTRMTMTQAKLQESETKRAVATGKVIEMRIVTVLFMQIRQAIETHVTDPATLRALLAAISFAVVAADEQRALGTGI